MLDCGQVFKYSSSVPLFLCGHAHLYHISKDSVRMCQNDYERIEQPSVVDVCLKPYKGTPDAQL